MSAIPKELFGLKVEVVRSKRKTSALHIIGDELQIRVPNRVRDGKIVQILETKKRWIRNKVVQIQSRPVSKEREFVSGESFSLFGKNLKLKVVEGGRVGTTVSYTHLTLPTIVCV